VFMTVNPDLIAGKRMQTVRSMVTALDKDPRCTLRVLPIHEIDFKTGKFAAYKRVKGGKFERVSMKHGTTPDVWINYTDGYYLDAAALGYKRRMDYIYRQFEFYEKMSAVSRVVNSAEAERNTLKDWFTQVDCRKLHISPTRLAESADNMYDLLKEWTLYVVKPIWGGAMQGVKKIDSKKALSEFLKEHSDHLSDFVCQDYREGAERRLWFVGDQFVGGRIRYSRKTPWGEITQRWENRAHTKSPMLTRDLKIATAIWKLSKLDIGCVDFIGNEVNEINGCGTTFVYYENWRQVVDARPALVDYTLSLLRD
jgi:hypothetical protein